MSWDTHGISYVYLHRNALPLGCPSDTTHPKLTPLKPLPRGQHQLRVLHSHCSVSSSLRWTQDFSSWFMSFYRTWLIDFFFHQVYLLWKRICIYYYISLKCNVWFQETNCKTHKASKVLFLGNLKMLLSTGNSRWNHRQIALWDQVGDSQNRLLYFSLFV